MFVEHVLMLPGFLKEKCEVKGIYGTTLNNVTYIRSPGSVFEGGENQHFLEEGVKIGLSTLTSSHDSLVNC